MTVFNPGNSSKYKATCSVDSRCTILATFCKSSPQHSLLGCGTAIASPLTSSRDSGRVTPSFALSRTHLSSYHGEQKIINAKVAASSECSSAWGTSSSRAASSSSADSACSSLATCASQPNEQQKLFAAFRNQLWSKAWLSDSGYNGGKSRGRARAREREREREREGSHPGLARQPSCHNSCTSGEHMPNRLGMSVCLSSLPLRSSRTSAFHLPQDHHVRLVNAGHVCVFDPSLCQGPLSWNTD